MKFRLRGDETEPFSRSPYGERGLKLPVRLAVVSRYGRSPYGELLILCDYADENVVSRYGRSPYGERGLKSQAETSFSSPSVALLTESVD